ncbi:MAG: dolichyl-phosphate beta-glucosyltransferase [Candidatus Moraniibacteriota bacterium]
MPFNHISVVVPCYKESEVIATNIQTLYEYLKERFEQYEIIIVTDGSPDNTRENVERYGNEHPEVPLILIPFAKNQGKGAAVKAGVLASKYDLVLFIDADLTIPIHELEKFISAIKSADIAIASRLVSGSSFEEKSPWHRAILARGFHLFQILVLGNFEFSDTQCGFKLFRRQIAFKLFNKITIKRFAFDAELLFLARKYNAKVAILPVHIKKDPRNTNVDVFRDPVNMIFALLKIRLNDWMGRYKEKEFVK